MTSVATSYDAQVLQILSGAAPQSIRDVLDVLTQLSNVLPDSDGVKWFNWLYLQVTTRVGEAVDLGECNDAKFVDLLDARFASLYFTALKNWLLGAGAPECWRALFAARLDQRIARVQFALAGINAHIDHDLAEAVVTTCAELGVTPAHGSAQYIDFTNLNPAIESEIDAAKRELMVTLPGSVIPTANQLEDMLADWGVSSARELAWINAEALWHLRGSRELYNAQLEVLDALSTQASRFLLVEIPPV
ncbi:MAG: hypothetical protein JOY54_12780 [Acidobacteriaceae bacterium]|nr:hypothetical protein [Acidobacteriaceae bacterium]